MSLADELLADLEEVDNDDLEEKLESLNEAEEELETNENEAPTIPMEIDVSVTTLKCKNRHYIVEEIQRRIFVFAGFIGS